jgi:hypothetical protein
MNLLGIPHRDGVTYNHERDGKRLHSQMNRVMAFMRDGKWHTLAEIARATGDPEASCSARIRDAKKERFQKLYGSPLIERRYVERGLWAYRLVVGQMELC